MRNIEHLARVYDATNSGLDIITELLPTVNDSVINKKKAFRLRPDERIPSAYLYPPDEKCDYWHVKDFGMREGDGSFSPIDLYMRDRGYTQSQFSLALHELMEKYGVEEKLTSKVNKPEIERRPATTEELGQSPRLTFRDDFTSEELAVWGPCVKAEHLTGLGWKAVESVARTKDRETIVTKATTTFPIFAQTCTYLDSNGNQFLFLKLYEPKNFNKAFRFSIVGKEPADYIFGLDALKRAYHQNDDKKLSEVLLVSGGSDAVNARSMGYLPVYLNSETKQLKESQLKLLHEYAWSVINIPDIDETGRRMGMSLARSLPTLFTAWLKPEDFHGLHDNRNRPCKDLKDYLRLHPTQKDMKRLVGRARRAQFWSKNFDERGNFKGYSICAESLRYFLWLHGYSTIKDDRQKEPQYIYVKNHIVRHVKAKSVLNFLQEWCKNEGLDVEIINKLMASRTALPTNTVSNLVERDDLDFTNCTATSQTFYFRNGIVEVKKEGIVLQPIGYGNGHYVWEDNIIQHDYRDMAPQFSVKKGDDGRYHITLNDDSPSKLLRFLVKSSRLYWRKEDEQGQELTEQELADEEQCLIVKLLNIGYMLHRYKSSSEARATLCQDYAMSENDDDANGRSGKSFYINAITNLVRFAKIDGRTLDAKTNKQFLYADVNETTGIIKVDECGKNFDYEYFFGQITDELVVERKRKDPVTIPFSKAPKFIFGTNYTLKKHDPSTDGRIWPVIFSDYYHLKTESNDYHETRTIHDDFGQDLMREGYSETDWQADIHLMLECLKLYLSLPVGERQQIPPMQRIKCRELLASIGKNAREWFNENLCEGSEYLDRKISSMTLFNAFVQDTRSQMSPKTFTEQLKNWCHLAEHIYAYNPASETHQRKDGDRWQVREGDKRVTYYYLQTVKAFEASNKESTQGELPL